MTRVLLRRTVDSGWDAQLESIASDASAAAGDIHASLALAERLAADAPLPGAGNTRELWEILASIGSVDLTAARVIEPHLDARAIFSEAGEPAPDGSWGVFAAEGAGTRVTASEDAGRWVLDGTKPWCSLAAHLTSALITAHTSEGRRLFAIDLRHLGVEVHAGGWEARGLTAVASGPITLTAVPALPVGADGWYLNRPGFAWGGAGVAAIWFGASVALARALFAALGEREPDQLGLATLGAVDRDLHACRAVLTAAATEVDEGSNAPAVLAQRVRSTAAHVAESTLSRVAHALGPAPLATDEAHARRVADLELYIRQDHAERDLARLGAKLLAEEQSPW